MGPDNPPHVTFELEPDKQDILQLTQDPHNHPSTDDDNDSPMEVNPTVDSVDEIDTVGDEDDDNDHHP